MTRRELFAMFGAAGLARGQATQIAAHQIATITKSQITAGTIVLDRLAPIPYVSVGDVLTAERWNGLVNGVNDLQRALKRHGLIE